MSEENKKPPFYETLFAMANAIYNQETGKYLISKEDINEERVALYLSRISYDKSDSYNFEEEELEATSKLYEKMILGDAKFEQELNEALKKYPDNHLLKNYQCIHLLRTEKVDEAEKGLNKILEDKPDYFPSKVVLAGIMHQRGIPADEVIAFITNGYNYLDEVLSTPVLMAEEVISFHNTLSDLFILKGDIHKAAFHFNFVVVLEEQNFGEPSPYTIQASTNLLSGVCKHLYGDKEWEGKFHELFSAIVMDDSEE